MQIIVLDFVWSCLCFQSSQLSVEEFEEKTSLDSRKLHNSSHVTYNFESGTQPINSFVYATWNYVKYLNVNDVKLH